MFKDRLLTFPGYLRNVIWKPSDVVFVSERVDWVIKEIGKSIEDKVQKKGELSFRTSYTAAGVQNSILHFGSVHTILNRDMRIRTLSSSNRHVVTWFHVEPDDKRVALIPELGQKIDRLHTACAITKEELISHGFPEEKIVVIPLGVDRSIFHRGTELERQNIRASLGIPKDTVVIGSFQKDGAGWGEGMTPKLVKGPDVFCDVVRELSKQFSVHVLLTGPARGYVKKRLSDAGIPYTHIYLKTYADIVPYYHALDLYIISSRVEGGPMAIMESWAMGVPLVTTDVGMAHDIVVHGKNAMKASVDDVSALVAHATAVLSNTSLRNVLVTEAGKTVESYDWDLIAKRYMDEMYTPLLKNI